MATCANCNSWMSALVYACPACGAKPKGPAPKGLVISDTLPTMGLDKTPRRNAPGSAAKPPRRRRSERAAGASETEPFPKAPGPEAGADPRPMSEAKPPPPRRAAPSAPGVRPAPRRAAAPQPRRTPPPDEPDGDEAASSED